MALKSAFWRDPNDPFAPLVAKRKIDAHTPEEEHAPVQAFTGAHPQDHPSDNTPNTAAETYTKQETQDQVPKQETEPKEVESQQQDSQEEATSENDD